MYFSCGREVGGGACISPALERLMVVLVLLLVREVDGGACTSPAGERLVVVLVFLLLERGLYWWYQYFSYVRGGWWCCWCFPCRKGDIGGACTSLAGEGSGGACTSLA